MQGSDVNDIVSTEQDGDFIRLEQLCADSGKTLSQVVRDAVEFYGAAKAVADAGAPLPGAVVGVSPAGR